jgi:hypothetical protein
MATERRVGSDQGGQKDDGEVVSTAANRFVSPEDFLASRDCVIQDNVLIEINSDCLRIVLDARASACRLDDSQNLLH